MVGNLVCQAVIGSDRVQADGPAGHRLAGGGHGANAIRLLHPVTHPDEVLPARETLVPAGETLHG